MVVFLLLFLVAVALGIIGVVAEGLGHLLGIGIALFVADVVFITAVAIRRLRRRPVR
ncbi:hypothetical protein [Streptomyces sp. ALI-76-A]|jgi:hypothetical protein|uniref:hypothetical protein n=1 Tax=Streptomyces sp. ALI-76-A TaxID=3025736 RepID=UPI00256F2F40|nr:hypothetical protein [Streptomyces sp. ALI-76-A]MDL5202759.1 hypothetical protein [Streptomyces sp. ALI-76-A]